MNHRARRTPREPAQDGTVGNNSVRNRTFSRSLSDIAGAAALVLESRSAGITQARGEQREHPAADAAHDDRTTRGRGNFTIDGKNALSRSAEPLEIGGDYREDPGPNHLVPARAHSSRRSEQFRRPGLGRGAVRVRQLLAQSMRAGAAFTSALRERRVLVFRRPLSIPSRRPEQEESFTSRRPVSTSFSRDLNGRMRGRTGSRNLPD